MKRKCRMVELKHCNELFLQFCMAYGTPDQERYREAYERAENAEQIKSSKETSQMAAADGEGSRTY